jgi:uncharacterized protein YbjT (DUF2867 family)
MGEGQILVLGATGRVGRRLADVLRNTGHGVRAASRSGRPRFDWTDHATWEPVLDGVSRMYLLAPDGMPVDPSFVALAVARGVDRIVLQSSAGIEVMGDERLMAAERTVRESGAQWTILRPNWFNQNFDEGFFSDAVRAGELALPVGDLRQAFVDARDIAAVAAAALTEAGHTGESYDVTGPQALSFAEALEVIGRAVGHPIRFDGTVDGYLAAQEAIGRSRDQVAGEIAAFTALADEGDTGPTDVVPRVGGRPATTFEAYAQEAAARGAWRRGGS